MRAKRIDFNDMSVRQINKWFRAHDESDKWPICGRFDATERAIRKAQRFMRASGAVGGFEYYMLVDQLLSDIVNKEV